MGDLARTITLIGAILVIIGIMLLAGKVPFFGKLPGDILIRKKNFTIYFPLATGILISIILSMILYLISRGK